MGEKKKGLGGLSKEKKKQLKALIMAKAAEDLKNEALKKKEERDKYIKGKVAKLEALDSLDKNGLIKLCKSLHSSLSTSHDEFYDTEFKMRKQDIEINELNMKVTDQKGKFFKPVLKKVSRTDSKFAKMDKKKKEKIEGVQLKASSASKYAVDDEEKKAADEEPVEEEEEE